MTLFRQTPVELPSFEEISAELRSDSADLTRLVDQLADKLKAELGPDHVYESRDAGDSRYGDDRVKAPKHADYISVKLGGDANFTLRYQNGVITPWINGETEQVPLEEWLSLVHHSAVELAAEQAQATKTITDVLEQGIEHASRPEVSSLADADETRLRPSGIAEGQSTIER